MLPRPIPELTKRQWRFIVERLGKCPPHEIRVRLDGLGSGAKDPIRGMKGFPMGGHPGYFGMPCYRMSFEEEDSFRFRLG